MKRSEIRVETQLDENHVPEHIHWEAEESGGRQEASAMFLALWDGKDRNTLRIDLWTKAMSVEEMKLFLHQNILTLADTFERATGEGRMAAQMRDFGAYFAEHMLGVGRDGG